MDRGIYIKDGENNYVVGPPNTVSSNTIELGEKFTIGWIVMDTNAEKHRSEPYVVHYSEDFANSGDYLFKFGFKDKDKM